MFLAHKGVLTICPTAALWKEKGEKKSAPPHLLYLLFLSPSVCFKSIYILFIHPHTGTRADEVIISLLSSIPPFHSPRQLCSPSGKCLFFLINVGHNVGKTGPPTRGWQTPPPPGAHSCKHWNQLHEILLWWDGGLGVCLHSEVTSR